MRKNKVKPRLPALILALLLFFGTGSLVGAASAGDAVRDTAAYLQETVPVPQVGSIGGEWAVLGLARWGGDLPQGYTQAYYQTVLNYVKACDGVLHDKKYTEYSRLVLALTAIGADPTDVGGYNLLVPLGDFEKTIWQGINGPVFALIALDSGSYEIPRNPAAATQATRQGYIDEILRRQLSDGGFSLFGGTSSAAAGTTGSDPDITAMALQALAGYTDQAQVSKVVEEALACLSKMQDADGGYTSWGSLNSESVAQVIVALCALDIDLDDPRFVKNGNTLLDNLLSYYRPGRGFRHTSSGSGSDLMATEQAFYALIACERRGAGKTGLYDMRDVQAVPYFTNEGTVGLPGRHAEVEISGLVAPGITFADISGHENQPAIEALAARAIVSGKTEQTFDPDATMTRAEFAAIAVRALGLSEGKMDRFRDVPEDAWYAGYIGAAYHYGIVTGASEDEFRPTATISRQEAAVMVSRAAALCGLDTAEEPQAIRDMLAQFGDYLQSADWARAALAFCYGEGILSQSDLTIEPDAAITRAQVAEMLFRLLGSAKLL